MQEYLNHPIAIGRTAEIFAWQNGKILKLFFDWFGLEAIQYEQRIAQAVQASGLPVPAVGEIVCVNDRNGLIYEQVKGISMSEMISSKPWRVFQCAQRMAELHVQMHNSTVQVDIPSQHQKLIEKINAAEILPSNLRSKSLFELKSLPERKQLCHGDFHPGNLMISGQNVIIIDWIDATLGNPLADIARTSILLRGAIETTQIQNPFHKLFIRSFHAKYMNHYFSLHPGKQDEYTRWLAINSAARLSENIPELEQWLIEQAQKG